jgi:hypothetical protein
MGTRRLAACRGTVVRESAHDISIARARMNPFEEFARHCEGPLSLRMTSAAVSLRPSALGRLLLFVIWIAPPSSRRSHQRSRVLTSDDAAELPLRHTFSALLSRPARLLGAVLSRRSRCVGCVPPSRASRRSRSRSRLLSPRKPRTAARATWPRNRATASPRRASTPTTAARASRSAGSTVTRRSRPAGRPRARSPLGGATPICTDERCGTASSATTRQ